MKEMLLLCLFATFPLSLVGQAPPAPAEPDFEGASGATINVGGTTYTIKVEQVLEKDSDNWDHNKVTIKEGTGTPIVYDPANVGSPVNSATEFGIQVWVGTPGDDYYAAETGGVWANHPAVMIGLAGGDWLVGTDLADWIFGNDGNDTLQGADGNDHIWGGSGNDTVSGLGGDDEICGGSGSDNLGGGDGVDFVWGDDGLTSYSAAAAPTRWLAGEMLTRSSEKSVRIQSGVAMGLT